MLEQMYALRIGTIAVQDPWRQCLSWQLTCDAGVQEGASSAAKIGDKAALRLLAEAGPCLVLG